MTRRRILIAASALLAVLAAFPVANALGDGSDGESEQPTALAATALTTAFTYQGRLLDAGAPANANYDIRFILYDSEAGGAQVGDTVTKAGVAVAAGLFTVQLDFGSAAFTGDARWLEISVKPAGGGTYLVLNPRQPITATPYALYAKAAGLAIPFAASAANTGATGLFSLTQTDSGIAFAGKRTYTGATEGDAISGSNLGAGAGVHGDTSFVAGRGVYGTVTSLTGTGVEGAATGGGTAVGGKFSGPNALQAFGTGINPVALEVSNGPIKVSGTNPTAFQHTAAAGNLCGANGTIVSNALMDADPNALVIVTPVGASVADVQSVAVAYGPVGTCAASAGKWVIFSSVALSTQKYNVLVIKR